MVRVFYPWSQVSRTNVVVGLFLLISYSLTPLQTASAQAVGCNHQAISELKTWTNAVRSMYGRPALANHGGLDYTGYVGSVYQSWWGMGHHYVYERISPYGFRTMGENVAYRYWYGALTAQAAANVNSWSVFWGWWTSPPHQANLLNPAFRYQGVWCYQIGTQVYWTQDFGA